MSQKKRKKRKTGSYTVSTTNPMELQETEKYKKFNPAARNLLLVDLVFLAIVQVLVNEKVIGDVPANVCTVAALIMLIAALWMQFGRKKKGPKTPHL